MEERRGPVDERLDQTRKGIILEELDQYAPIISL